MKYALTIGLVSLTLVAGHADAARTIPRPPRHCHIIRVYEDHSALASCKGKGLYSLDPGRGWHKHDGFVHVT